MAKVSYNYMIDESSVNHTINRIFYSCLVLIAFYIVWICPERRTFLQIISVILCPFFSIIYNIVNTDGLTICKIKN